MAFRQQKWSAVIPFYKLSCKRHRWSNSELTYAGQIYIINLFSMDFLVLIHLFLCVKETYLQRACLCAFYFDINRTIIILQSAPSPPTQLSSVCLYFSFILDAAALRIFG